jgi:hypothetical protein
MNAPSVVSFKLSLSEKKIVVCVHYEHSIDLDNQYNQIVKLKLYVCHLLASEITSLVKLVTVLLTYSTPIGIGQNILRVA